MLHDTDTLPEGIAFTEIVRPESVGEVADLLRAASERGTPVVPVGGGTALGIGNPADHAFLGVDLRALSGVRSYEPADMTASFHAGTTLSEVSAVLGEHGQELPLDMPQPEQATIGGLVATGFSGPRRMGSGTLKDLLIGCAYVRGDGLAAKAGGMLVKNVSGFEIPRLLHGSWGSLAVLTSVNLKIVPRPRADYTYARDYVSLDDALAAQAALLDRHPFIQATVIERRDPAWTLHVRLLGRERALRAQVASIEDDLGAGSDLVEDDRFWREYNDRWVPDDAAVRLVIGARPHRTPDLARTIIGWPGVRAMAISTPTGSLRVSLDPDIVSSTDVAARLTAPGVSADVSWTLESAPASWRGDLPTWSAPGQSIGIMRAIKQQFDPAGILNRDRLVI